MASESNGLGHVRYRYSRLVTVGDQSMLVLPRTSEQPSKLVVDAARRFGGGAGRDNCVRCGMTDLKHFSHDELADRETGEVRLAPGFGAQLEILRTSLDEPMKVNSCCRSKKRNIEVGGHPHSLHVYDKPFHSYGGTLAIDISTPDAAYAKRLVQMALLHGWSVGVAKTFVHLDRRDMAGRLRQVVFGY